MYAIEFETKTIDGMIPIPKQYTEINDDESIRVIILKEDSDKEDLKLYKDSELFQIDKKALEESLDDYKQNGDKNFVSQNEYHKQMDNYKKDLIAKYANH